MRRKRDAQQQRLVSPNLKAWKRGYASTSATKSLQKSGAPEAAPSAAQIALEPFSRTIDTMEILPAVLWSVTRLMFCCPAASRPAS